MKFEFTEQQAQIVWNSLAEQPAKVVYQTMKTMEAQLTQTPEVGISPAAPVSPEGDSPK